MAIAAPQAAFNRDEGRYKSMMKCIFQTCLTRYQTAVIWVKTKKEYWTPEDSTIFK